ncbi:hypothetical protein EKL02_11010 [Janthinobacterium sp. 17J80-10]|nr:hypothetical protein EKL02_11010 [Janthinobacterium sp. 17J80-10]
MVGAIFGAAASIGTQYWITYKGIESPKIEIEKKKLNLESQKTELDFKKASIDAHKQILALTPNINANCSGSNIDPWVWRVSCSLKNNGIYHADVSINSASIRLARDTSEKVYKSGQGFNISFANEKKFFRAPPQSSGDLWFYINFSKSEYKSGFFANDMVALVNFRFETIDAITNFFITQFPDLNDQINQIGRNGIEHHIQLPPALTQ